MGQITDEMKQLIEQVRLSYVATAGKDGKPNVSPKGSIAVLDDETLVFADLYSEKTRKNLLENPQVAIDVLNVEARKGFQFKGRVELLQDGPIYDKVAENLKQKMPKLPPPKYVVKVKVAEVYKL
ncbi:MAG: pyridoxamine 5'-phosphate oxidase family protein [Pseudomonadota bacterium]